MKRYFMYNDHHFFAAAYQGQVNRPMQAGLLALVSLNKRSWPFYLACIC
jgi:hypothetical protein